MDTNNVCSGCRARLPLQGPFLPGYEPTGDPAAATPPGAGLGFERIDHAVFNTHNLMEAVQYMAGALGGWPALLRGYCVLVLCIALAADAAAT